MRSPVFLLRLLYVGVAQRYARFPSQQMRLVHPLARAGGRSEEEGFVDDLAAGPQWHVRFTRESGKTVTFQHHRAFKQNRGTILLRLLRR